MHDGFVAPVPSCVLQDGTGIFPAKLSHYRFAQKRGIIIAGPSGTEIFNGGLLWAHHAIRVRIRQCAFCHQFKNTFVAKLASHTPQKSERRTHRP